MKTNNKIFAGLKKKQKKVPLQVMVDEEIFAAAKKKKRREKVKWNQIVEASLKAYVAS